MKILEYDSHGSVELITNTNGVVIYITSAARQAFNGIRVGGSVSKIVDIDYIQKVSMFSDRLDVIPTLVDNYKEARVMVFSNGFNKFVKLTFFKGKYKRLDGSYKKEKMMASVMWEASKLQDISTISLKEFGNKLSAIVKNQNYYVSTSSTDDSFYYSEALLLTMILNSLSIINESLPDRLVDISLEKQDNKLSVKLISSVEKSNLGMNWSEFGELYPWISLRASFMDASCERNKINHSVSVLDNCLRVELLFEELERGAEALYFKPRQNMLSWESIYEALKPRAMHDIQGVMQVE